MACVPDDVKVGDQFGVSPAGFHNKATEFPIVTVTKVTKTQITCSDGRRYTRSWGRQVGGSSWSARRLVEVEFANRHNKEAAKEIYRGRMIGAITDACAINRLRDMPDEHLETLYTAVESVKKTEAA